MSQPLTHQYPIPLPITLRMQPTAYFACNPIDFTEWAGLFTDEAHYSITIELRGYKWAICQRSWNLNREGGWEHEPQPSSRDDAFKERTRYTLEEAKSHLQSCMPQIISELLHELKMRHGSPENVRQERGT